MKEYEKNRFNNECNDLANKDLKTNLLMAKLNPMMTTLLNIGLVINILVGAFLVKNGKALSGDILTLVTYCTMTQTALMSISRLYQVYNKAIASFKRISEVNNFNEEKLIEKEEFNFNKTIKFNNLSFGYYAKKNLSNISFEIKKGQSVGFIGMTGSGKTTLINLLTKLYYTDNNSIFIDNVDINNITASSLKENIGYSLQDGMIFNDSIRNNLCLNKHFDEQEIIKACKTSDSYDFIMKKENNFEYILNQGGSNLSGGQRQRILISRALLHSKDILIIDDSLSALDYLTELNVRKSIKENYPNLTFINVSQRISSIKNFDLIVVFDKGKIEYGTHEELLKKSKLYLEMYNSQVEVTE
jgi:ATP-binding cassette subfamily B protein